MPLVQTVLLLSAYAVLALACGTTSPYTLGASDRGYIITTGDGRNRTFNIYVPSGYNFNTPTALMFFFHGGGGTGALYEARYGMDAQVEPNKGIVVYPDGVQNTWNGGTCCGPARTLNVDDVGFVNQLIDNLIGSLCIDQSRIYAIGHSNGAILSHRLGCQLSNRVVAIAPVEGTMGIPTCTPSNPVVVYEIHGTDDPNIPFNGGSGCGPTSGFNFTSVPYTIGVWETANGCGITPTASYTLNDTTCSTYGQGCNAPVTLCVVEYGDHSWSGGPGGFNVSGNCFGGQTGAFPATQQIWAYLSTISRAPTSLTTIGGPPTGGTTVTVSSATGPSSTATSGSASASTTTSNPTTASLTTGSPATATVTSTSNPTLTSSAPTTAATPSPTNSASPTSSGSGSAGSSKSSGTKLSTGAIIGIAIGAAVVLAIIVGVMVYFFFIRKSGDDGPSPF